MKIRPFDGVIDFAMWQVKMRVILIKEGCWKAITHPVKHPEALTQRFHPGIKIDEPEGGSGLTPEEKAKQIEDAQTFEADLELDLKAHSEIMLRLTDGLPVRW